MTKAREGAGVFLTFTSQLGFILLTDNSNEFLTVHAFLRIELSRVVVDMRLDIDTGEIVPGKGKRHDDLLFEERVVILAAAVLVAEVLYLFPFPLLHVIIVLAM